MLNVIIPKTRILIVERHPIVILGLRKVLEGQPDMEVVGHCYKRMEVLRHMKEAQPDVVILDTSLLESEASLKAAIREAFQPPKVVGFGAAEGGAALMRILAAGVSGYVSKCSTPEQIVQALRSVVAGNGYLESNLLRGFYPAMYPPTGMQSWNRITTLSEREEKVLRLVACGYVLKDVGAELGVSSKTAETYKARGMQKLGLRSRPEVVQYAAHHGWLEELRAG